MNQLKFKRKHFWQTFGLPLMIMMLKEIPNFEQILQHFLEIIELNLPKYFHLDNM